MDKIIFPVNHNDFYDKFIPWCKEISKQKITKEGVYILKSTISVPRCLKEDKSGILYIGKGIIISSSSRLGKLINALNQTEGAHGGGVRFNDNKILEKYTIDTLSVEVILQEKSRNLEIEKLNNYQLEFGELPPLNNQN